MTPSFRGRKALGLGSVVSPRPQPSTTSISPAPASLPQPSPNTTTSVSSNSILVTGTAATPVASHSIPQQQQVSAIVPSPGHTMKEQPQQPMKP
ncbi:hypothetical protein Bhyg_06027 [Pseudolycoriella hygida]|uniref:Uncharacterized protein n=1 Tax=Pseudolycoriella hygida TaxID=35572 RepID=A0A9Q0MZU9_9DIPT|nr:hypothetical protein Bhyg_06027 [Pseudolycoriella hygida]